jgi:hypothetical protein
MLGRISVVLVPLLLVVWLLQRSRRAGPLALDKSRRNAALAEHRRAVGWRWAGLALGVVAAAWTMNIGWLGLGVMLAPTVFGLCVIGGVVVGELAAIPRIDGVRTATLTTRSVRDYLPWRLGGLVAVSTLGLGALLVTTTLMGSADDLGRAGRSLSLRCSSALGAGAGPWPGLFYSVPLGIAVVIGLLAAAVALRTVVLRARTGSAPEVVAADDALRSRSAEAVVAATGVMVAASLLGVALTAAAALIGFPCAPTWWTLLGFALLVVGALMLVLALWCLALLLSRPRLPPAKMEEMTVDGRAAPDELRASRQP